MIYIIYSYTIVILQLVGGLEHEFYCSIQLGIVTPSDEIIFSGGGETTKQYKT